MNLREQNFVRFKDWSSPNSNSSEQQYSAEYGFYASKIRPTLSTICHGVCRVWKIGCERIGNLKKPLSLRRGVATKKSGTTTTTTTTEKKILDPQGPFLQRWNKFFVFACVIAVSIDPLFFYIPVVDGQHTCLKLDKKLETVACILRTAIDAFYIIRMIFQFRTGFIAPSSRVFGRGELVEDPVLIAARYLMKYFIIDVLSILPLPQIVVLIIIPNMDGPVSLIAKNLLKIVIISQYVPRFIRIYPLYKEVTTSSGILTETAWAGAAFNLLLYMLASHVIGAFWYLYSIEREDRCWRNACKRYNLTISNLYCGEHRTEDYNILTDLCSFNGSGDGDTNSTFFQYGIAGDALKSGVLQTMDFPQKFFYCFWWGLRNVSSLGQNLKTSTYVGEILFAIFISISGLVLFALLIGNMQKYLQSTTVRVEEMRVRRRDAEQWMSHRMLPDKLKERIRQYEQYKWQETRGVEERSLIRNLPKDLRRDINRHLCLDLLKRVPMFEKMDEHILDAVCDRLKPALYTKDSYIVREGDPVDEMLFIMRGNIVSATTNFGKTGFFNAVYLKPGDFCGEGLLTWALDPQPSSNLPISTRTVQALSEVESFALGAEDLKTVASQFQRLQHKDIQHIFKFYSVQWMTWAACFIQVVWRRYCKRKQAKLLRQAEDELQGILANESGTTAPSLGVTLYASRFAANTLKNLRQSGARHVNLPQRLQLLPPKPSEPKFSPQGH